MDDFERFFDHSLDLNAIANAEGYFRRVNIAWERTLGWTPGEITASPWLDFVHPADRQSTVDVGQRLFEGATVISFENRYRCKDGSYRLIQWHAEVVGGEAYCSGRDVTEERARLDFRALVDNLPELAWMAKPDGFIDFYNRRWYEYTGTTYEDMEGWGWQSVHDPDELPRVMAGWTQSIATHQPFDQAFPLRRYDGVFRWFLTRVAPMFDDSGKLIRWVGINTDIDDQRRAQEARSRAEEEKTRLVDQLQALNADLEERVRSRTTELSKTLQERESLLREKTSLLQEVHHRVKNNLQMISSLLNLQARQIKDVETRAFFRESQGRVRSIALLHESLYQSDDLGRVDMHQYVDKLVATLRRTYQQNARVVTEIDRTYLPVDAAVPCGLIVNELMTNALKHAFAGSGDAPQNEIRIEMRRVHDDLELVVSDNGIGFAATVDPTRDETMGLTLVRDLSLQLRGLAEFTTANGARCTVRFPAPRQGTRS